MIVMFMFYIGKFSLAPLFMCEAADHLTQCAEQQVQKTHIDLRQLFHFKQAQTSLEKIFVVSNVQKRKLASFRFCVVYNSLNILDHIVSV